MGLSTCELTPEEYGQQIAQQVSQLRMGINQNNAISSPFPSLIPGGTFPSNDGIDVRTLVANRVSPGTSLVRPAFVDNREVCGTTGAADKIGQTEFTARLFTYRGKGPLVCVKGSFYSVTESYNRAETSLQENISNLVAVDIRANIHDLSGVKLTLSSTALASQGFAGLVSGGRNQLGVDYNGQTPDSTVTFKLLIRLGQFMKETLRLRHFSGAYPYFMFVGSAETVEQLRSQVDSNIIAAVQGGYLSGYGKTVGADQLASYAFDSVVHRGWMLGIDQEPLRASGLDAQGQPIFVEPVIEVDADEGKDAIANPEWLEAPFEVSFAVAPDSFRRLVPESYVGEGSWRFAPQTVMGELIWRNTVDNECNVWQDFGRHYYQITRAFLPEIPHAVIPILHTRCEATDLLIPCGGGTPLNGDDLDG